MRKKKDRKMRQVVILIIVAFVAISGTETFAWNDEITHPHVTFESVRFSSFGKFTEEQLKLADGAFTNLNGKRLHEWLQHGAEQEDYPSCRASNHFHDPYKPWDQSGLSDTQWLVELWCWGLGMGQYPFSDISSNLTWATGYSSETTLNHERMDFNQQDWASARQYFYTYLTGRDYPGNMIALDEGSRNNYGSSD